MATLMRSPLFRRTPRGQVVCELTIGVPNEDGSESVKTVLAFGRRAEALRGKLATGMAVGIIGYLHLREKPAAMDHSAPSRVIEEINAVRIIPRS